MGMFEDARASIEARDSAARRAAEGGQNAVIRWAAVITPLAREFADAAARLGLATSRPKNVGMFDRRKGWFVRHSITSTSDGGPLAGGSVFVFLDGSWSWAEQYSFGNWHLLDTLPTYSGQALITVTVEEFEEKTRSGFTSALRYPQDG